MEGVAIALVVHRHKVHHADVGGMGIEASDPHLEGGEHPAARLRDDHLGALGVELIPQCLRLQDDDGLGQGRMYLFGFLLRVIDSNL